MNGELKPCPFCGDIPELQYEVVNVLMDYPKSTATTAKESWSLFCHKCGCGQYAKYSRIEVIEAWNKRYDK